MGVPAVDLKDAPQRLLDLVDEALEAGRSFSPTTERAAAKIIPLRRARAPRQPGSARGMVHMADDFDATPEDFRDYM